MRNCILQRYNARQADLRQRSRGWITVFLPLILLLSACTPVVGSGQIISEEREATGFSEIELTGNGEVIIEQTSSESLTVSADDNVLPLVTTAVRGDRLILGVKPGIMLTNATIRYEVTVADLTELGLTGSGNIEVTNLAGKRLKVVISGSGNIVAEGAVNALDVDISGSGEFDGETLTSEQVDARVSGSGNILVNATETLDASISGSGNIQYVGEPQVTAGVSGSGSVSPK